MLEKLKEIFAAVMPVSGVNLDLVTEDTRLDEDLGCNSISMLMMAVVIEQEFGIRLSTVKAGDLITVGDLMRFIERSENDG